MLGTGTEGFERKTKISSFRARFVAAPELRSLPGEPGSPVENNGEFTREDSAPGRHPVRPNDGGAL